MNGEVLREKLRALNIPQAQIAEACGMSAQAFNHLFRAQDIKTGTLEMLCDILQKDMSFFYPACAVKSSSLPNNVNRQNNDVIQAKNELITNLQRQIQSLQQDKEDLRSYIRTILNQNSTN